MIQRDSADSSNTFQVVTLLIFKGTSSYCEGVGYGLGTGVGLHLEFGQT